MEDNLTIGTIARILNQDPELYADIAMYNKEAKERIRENINQVKELGEIIENNSKEEFVKYFKESKDFHKGFEEKAFLDSEFLISQLTKKEEESL